MSLKLPAGKLKLKTASCVAKALPIACASTGASLRFCTVSPKSPYAAAPATSVAVTRSVSAPTSALAGVPLKRCVLASKLSQAGSAAPELSVAV